MDGQKAIAVTDHGTLGGIIEAYTACKKAGIKLIPGMEMYVDAFELREKNFPGHLTVLARNENGYRSLIAANNLAARQFYYRPRVALQQIIENDWAKDWIILSGCMSSPIHNFPMEESAHMVRQLANASGGFYLETMWHYSEDEEFSFKMQEYHNRVKDLHEMTGIPVVLTNDCHFARWKPNEWLFGQLMQHADMKGELEFDGEGFYFKLNEQMNAIAESLGCPDAWKLTDEIAEQCDVAIPEADKLNWHVPDITNGKPEETLKLLCEPELVRLEERIGNVKEYIERYNYELAVLKTSPAILNSYLVTHDVVTWCNSRNIPVAARGSMAGSLVSYLLGITKEDPVKYNLSFSRAVNPARPTIPDFDLDVSSIYRAEILEYLKERYIGNIPIATYTHYGPKGVVRKILRSEGMLDPLSINEISKQLPDDWPKEKLVWSSEVDEYVYPPPKSLEEENHLIKEISARDHKTIIYRPKWAEPIPRRFFNFVPPWEGLFSSVGVHPSGLLISGPERALEHEVPFTWVASSKTLAASFDMYTLKKIGLFKLDVLGLKTLDQLAYMERVSGKKLPDDNYDDPEVLAAFGQDLLAEIFQMDGYACREVLKAIKGCNTFEDIVAANTLARPGSAQFTPYYRTGFEGLVDEYPALKEVLGPTNGLILYQEQVMEIARVLADFNDAEQDDIKESIKYFRKENWKATIEPLFRERCEPKGIDPTHILEAISRMASYTYNRAHALTYAAIAYKMMWYKVYYPAVYYAGVYDGAGDKARLVLESHAYGVKWRPADVNYSEAETVVKGDEIILGLSAIKGVGPAACEAILAVRPFSSLEDMQARINKRRCNSGVIEKLQKAWACGSLSIKGTIAAFEESFGFNYRYLDPGKSIQLQQWTEQDTASRLGGYLIQLREFKIAKDGPNKGKEMAQARIVNIKGSRKAVLFPDVWKKAKGKIHVGMAVAFRGEDKVGGDFFVEHGEEFE